MGYRVTKDLRAEVRVGGSLVLKDLFLLILFPVIMWFITGSLVASGLEIWYVGYNVLVALILVQRPSSNPGKQVWQIILFLLEEDDQTYHMIPRPFLGKKDGRDLT